MGYYDEPEKCLQIGSNDFDWFIMLNFEIYKVCYDIFTYLSEHLVVVSVIFWG